MGIKGTETEPQKQTLILEFQHIAAFLDKEISLKLNTSVILSTLLKKKESF